MTNPYFPLVSIIVVNYNNISVTRDLLKSLRRVTYPAVEIIVVDNNSADKVVEILPAEFPEITLIASPTNLGYAGGNNLGIKSAHGDYFLVTNNDVEVTPNFLEPLIGVFKNFPRAGIVSPKIIYHSNGRIQYAGSTGINPWTGRGTKIAHLKADDGSFDHIRETELVHGACMMFSKRVVEEVGLIPELFFIYYEEHDWAQQARLHGFKMYYVGTSKIFHKASATAGVNSPFQTYYMVRNRIMYLRRNVSHPALASSMLFFLFFALPKSLLQYAIRRDVANTRAFLKGVLWHFRNSSQVRQKTAAIVP